MRVKINNGFQDYRTVWMEGNVIHLIDQPKLPHAFEIYQSDNYRKSTVAIRDMVVRGAPAIGATAAYAMVQAVLGFSDDKKDSEMEFRAYMNTASEFIRSARPTAHDLFHAVDLMNSVIDNVIDNVGSLGEVKIAVKKAAKEYADRSAERCRKIGEIGEELIEDNMRVLTHCNAGALGCVDYGTALSPIRLAHDNGKEIHVFVDETRPRCQGSRLTAWELLQEDISHSLIADNAAGYYMYKGEVDMVIVGADRITVNGDIINKIGTYEKAVLARENGIPVYVAAPETTIDFNCRSGDRVTIEERNDEEVLYMQGICDGEYDKGNEGKFTRIRIAPVETHARNPAFDVTPAKYITGIITEMGIFKPDDIEMIKEKCCKL